MKGNNKAALIKEVQQWFLRHVSYEGEAYTVDAEQATAIVDDSKNAIVVARAGSGKTRTIVAKIIYLVTRCNVRPEEIMAFVFNANAAAEINARLSKMLVDGAPVISDAKIANTFHAFSRKIVYDVYGGRDKCGKILAGGKEDFVQIIVCEMMMQRKWHNKIRWFIRGSEDKESRKAPLFDEEVKNFAKVMATFINRAQQKFLAGENILKKSAEARLKNEGIEYREKIFIELGIECYRRYHWYLLNGTDEQKGEFKEYGTDFNLIVAWAGKLISRGTKEARGILGRKKVLLIDEYQDFSQLFLSVVLAIRRVRPDIKLFVVGDDWQAINRFAGSDVEYFRDFQRFFPEGVRKMEISTNYRCNFEIVDAARKFMKKAMGEKGDFRAFSKKAGSVILVDSRKTRLFDIVRREKRAKEILVLHRNNDTHMTEGSLINVGATLREEVLANGVMSEEQFDEKVKLMTMHKSKGLESEVVVILEADEGVIPKIHPDTNLYAIFGETEEMALDDQKRLFYVAMTRAKKRLYIMHDSSGGLGFTKYLGRWVEKWED